MPVNQMKGHKHKEQREERRNSGWYMSNTAFINGCLFMVNKNHILKTIWKWLLAECECMSGHKKKYMAYIYDSTAEPSLYLTYLGLTISFNMKEERFYSQTVVTYNM